MTNKEALVAVVQVSIDDNSLEKALLDQGVVSNTSYDPANAVLIDKSAISILETLLSMPDVSEGGYSINFDRNSVQSRLTYLRRKNGISDPGLTVRGVSVW